MTWRVIEPAEDGAVFVPPGETWSIRWRYLPDGTLLRVEVKPRHPRPLRAGEGSS